MIEDIKVRGKKGNEYILDRNGVFYRSYTKEKIEKIVKNILLDNHPIKKIKKAIDEYEKNEHEKKQQYIIFKSLIISKPIININKSLNKKCIYCKKNEDKKLKTKDHVIQDAFIRKNIVLEDCVCGECNQYFKPLEQKLARTGVISYARFDKGKIKSKENFYQKYTSLNTGEIFEINRKTGKFLNRDKEDIYFTYISQMSLINIEINRMIVKNIFNFITKYIGYDEIMKKYWDNVRNYIRNGNVSLRTNILFEDKTQFCDKLINFEIFKNGVNIKLENKGKNVIGSIQFYDCNFFHEYILIKDYNIPNFNELSALFIPYKDPIFYNTSK